MFTELNSILNTNPDSVTQGEFILLSDRRSDASFLIHHFLSLYLKAGCRVWFVALVQSFNHYSAISQRLPRITVCPPPRSPPPQTTSLGGEQAAAPETDLQSDQTLTLRDRIAPPPLHIRKPSVAAVTQGVSLSQAKEKGQLVFLEGLKESLSVLIPQETDTGSDIMDFFRDPAAGLKSLYQFVSSSLTSDDDDEEGRGPPVLLVDDISILLSLGLSVGDVLDFSHYCRASVCSQGSVLMLARCEEEDDDGDDEGSERLLKGLTHLSSLSLHVQGLPTGYCRDIHGQVEVCWRRRQGDGQHSQKKVFQYKVHDKGASFFAPGTSSAVL